MALSAAATSQDQILAMLMMTAMLSMVFSGALIPVIDRFVLGQMSWVARKRGFAASAHNGSS